MVSLHSNTRHKTIFLLSISSIPTCSLTEIQRYWLWDLTEGSGGAGDWSLLFWPLDSCWHRSFLLCWQPAILQHSSELEKYWDPAQGLFPLKRIFYFYTIILRAFIVPSFLVPYGILGEKHCAGLGRHDQRLNMAGRCLVLWVTIGPTHVWAFIWLFLTDVLEFLTKSGINSDSDKPLAHTHSLASTRVLGS